MPLWIFSIEKIMNFSDYLNKSSINYIGAIAQWLRHWIPNLGVPCSKPLGGSKVESALFILLRSIKWAPGISGNLVCVFFVCLFFSFLLVFSFFSLQKHCQFLRYSNYISNISSLTKKCHFPLEVMLNSLQTQKSLELVFELQFL